MAERGTEDAVYQAEQRRYRRLEVSLPLWLTEEDDFNKPGSTSWSLGYTRDISMGGTKVIVPDGEEERWRDAAKRNAVCLVRYDAPGCSTNEYIAGRVKHAARETDTGRVWLGIEYEPGNDEEKSAAVRAGVRTVKSRRKWQFALVLSLMVIGFAAFFINQLRGDVVAQQARIAQLQKSVQQEQQRLSALSRARVVSTRAEGINDSFARKEVQEQIRKLNANLQRLNNPDNREAAERERVNQRAAEGISLSNAPATGVNVNLGVALPYGYAWPQVTSNLEQLLGREIPTIVVFRDFQSSFPLEDAREARIRAKTLQITWEPWHFSNPNAITLANITAGKHDKYIDQWAQASKSFGGEVWVRFAHEFNGNWYPWSISANGQSAQKYIAAYRHVHDRFTRAGAFNVRWIWCINAETVPNTAWNDPLRAYPGDSYVDMIAIDGYNFGNSLSHSRWLSFEEIFASPYAKLTKRFPNKPIMVGETGCATVGGDKPAWIRDMDKQIRTNFPRLSGVVWFEVQKEADWRMASSLDSLKASRAVWNQNYYQRGVS
ncbi:MAG TPA: glycosyl hydrolase [Abditibacteriaceae bacterium]